MSNQKNTIFLSIIIPARNEEQRIVETLESISQYIKSQKKEIEVIVVSNDSTDKTVEVSEAFSSKINNLTVMNISGKGGKGWAVKRGMQKARGDYAVFMDADNATKITEIEKFWKYFEKYDIVIGSRALKSSMLTKKQPWYRQIIGKAGNFVIQALLIPGIKDTQCGFKAFSRKAYTNIFPMLSIYGWGFDIEVLAIARNQGLNVKEEGITWHNDEESKVQPVDAAVSTLKEVFQIRKNLNQGKYDLKKKFKHRREN